jgi:hypothetical protein
MAELDGFSGCEDVGVGERACADFVFQASRAGSLTATGYLGAGAIVADIVE